MTIGILHAKIMSPLEQWGPLDVRKYLLCQLTYVLFTMYLLAAKKVILVILPESVCE